MFLFFQGWSKTRPPVHEPRSPAPMFVMDRSVLKLSRLSDELFGLDILPTPQQSTGIQHYLFRVFQSSFRYIPRLGLPRCAGSIRKSNGTSIALSRSNLALGRKKVLSAKKKRGHKNALHGSMDSRCARFSSGAVVSNHSPTLTITVSRRIA